MARNVTKFVTKRYVFDVFDLWPDVFKWRYSKFKYKSVKQGVFPNWMSLDQVKGVILYVNSKEVSAFKRGITGALLFGGVGATIGVLSSIKAKPKSDISVVLITSDLSHSAINIPCTDIGTATRVISTLANLEERDLKSREKKIENGTLIEDSEVLIDDSDTTKKASFSEEVMKLKKMLDYGIIDMSLKLRRNLYSIKCQDKFKLNLSSTVDKLCLKRGKYG